MMNGIRICCDDCGDDGGMLLMVGFLLDKVKKKLKESKTLKNLKYRSRIDLDFLQH